MLPLQINKFLELHDGERIFFTKHDCLPEAAAHIETLNRDVVLIINGSDFCVYNETLEIVPHNVKKIFTHNCHADLTLTGDRVVPIPRGIEVSEAIKINDYAWCGMEIEGEEKRLILSSPPEKEPSKFIYANFRVATNSTHRTQIKNIAIEKSYITWKEPPGRNDRERFECAIPYMEFVEDILDHQAVLCAQGNDWGCNLRIYETLYLSRVPLTFNPVLYHNLHNIFPTVLIEDLKQLDNKDELRKKIENAEKKRDSSRKYLDFNYWKDMILEESKKLK